VIFKEKRYNDIDDVQDNEILVCKKDARTRYIDYANGCMVKNY